MTLTTAEYLARKGCVCPACESENFEVDVIEVDGDTASSYVKCKACGASWSDIFTLTGYADLCDGNGKPIESGDNCEWHRYPKPPLPNGNIDEDLSVINAILGSTFYMWESRPDGHIYIRNIQD
jgi:Zn finger protein HypA/HybF involved in hydrogenase expression